uniref:(California timema) hypothetical protein n=1 Tax=Timema californicum TaxID=61474 RepID=A0A7R9P886_TIMCA|nr:unnamed protein product [Timema californicum]
MEQEAALHLRVDQLTIGIVCAGAKSIDVMLLVVKKSIRKALI